MNTGLSIVSLIINATIVVQAVMLILVVMSLYSWIYIFTKSANIFNSQKAVKAFERKLNEQEDLHVLQEEYKTNGANNEVEAIFIEGYEEFLCAGSEDKTANAERAYRMMIVAANRYIENLNDGLPTLAIIANISPFIGLFGTVWGIMHSFIGLANVQQATIAIVAPGIAEALIATAIGLFVAIPANFFHNKYIANIDKQEHTLYSFIEEILVVFQR